MKSRPRKSKSAELSLDITTFRLDRSGIGVALGDLETELMELIWRRPPGQAVTVREIWQELYPRHPVMYTTVMNTMVRLARKGLLATERKGIAFAYTPTLSRDEFIDRFVGSALERLLVNFGGATLARLREMDDPAVQSRVQQQLAAVERRRATRKEG